MGASAPPSSADLQQFPAAVLICDSMLRFAGPASAVAALALATVTLAHPSATRLHTWPWALAVLLLWLLPLVALAVGLLLTPVWRLPPPLFLIGLLLLGVAVLGSALASPFASASLPRVWPTLGGIAWVLTTHHFLAENDSAGRTVARGLAALGATVILSSFLLWWGGESTLPWGTRNTAPFGHSTYTAGAVVLLLPAIALQVWSVRGPLSFAGWVLGGLGLLVLASTSSRGGALAVAVVTAITAACLLFRARWSRSRKLAVLIGLGAVATLVIASNPRLRELVIHRRWSESATESNLQRAAMVDAGTQLGRERPLIGWGPGTVPLAYPQVRVRLEGGADNVLQLHSTPLQLWATTGVAGTLAGFLLVIATLRLAVAARRPIALAAAGGVAGLGIMSLTDHQLDLPLFASVMAIYIALLSSSASPDWRTLPSRWVRRAVAASVILAIAIPLPATLRDLKARRHYDEALDALETRRPAAAYTALAAATAAAPHDPFYEHQHASLLLAVRAGISDAAEATRLTRNAATLLDRSLATGSHTEYAHFNLGWLLLDLEQPAEAARHFAAAARLVPDRSGVYFGLGLALLARPQPDAAIRAFALEWLNDPRSLTSPAWETPALAAHVPAIHAEVLRLCAALRPQHPAATVAESWIRWWRGETNSPDALRPHNTESAAFLRVLPALASRAPLPPDISGFAWAQAHAAWLGEPSANAFLSVARGDAEFAAALARRAVRSRDDFRAFLAGPTGDDAAVVATYYRQRTGQGVLALHPEGPPLTDAFIVQDHRVATSLAAGLFPRKGSIPGRFLLASLPELP